MPPSHPSNSSSKPATTATTSASSSVRTTPPPPSSATAPHRHPSTTTTPTTRPRPPPAHAPHWLGSATAPTSTIDLIGSAFTLIAAHDGQAWIDAAHHAASVTGVPIDTYRVDAAGLADHGDFAGAYGITTRGAVLIRPDDHIAWRNPHAPEHADPLIDIVRTITTASAPVPT
jgi:hypothetical protein